MNKDNITDNELRKTYKTKQEKEGYLSSINKNLSPIKLSIDDRLKAIVDKYKNKKPSKAYIENIKSQSWYQLECIKCKYSNRKWLEEGKYAFEYPIKMTELPSKRGLKIFYFCNNCDISWRG